MSPDRLNEDVDFGQYVHTREATEVVDYMLRAAASTEFAAAVILGAGGIGKTSLIRLVASRLREGGHLIVYVNGRDMRSASQLASEIARQLLSALENLQIDRQSWTSSGATLEAVLRRQLSDAATQTATAMQDVAERLPKGMSLIVVLDDLVLGSDERMVAGFLRRLTTSRPGRLKLIIASRDAALPERAQLDHRDMRVFHLRGLTPNEAFEILRFRLSQSSISESELRRLAESVNGNPYLLNILAIAVHDSGISQGAALQTTLDAALRRMVEIAVEDDPDTRRLLVSSLNYVRYFL